MKTWWQNTLTPINKLFTCFKNRRAGSQQGLMLWRHEAVLPWESSVGLEGSGKVLPWNWLWLAQAYFTWTWLRILQIHGMFTPP